MICFGLAAEPRSSALNSDAVHAHREEEGKNQMFVSNRIRITRRVCALIEFLRWRPQCHRRCPIEALQPFASACVPCVRPTRN